MNDKTLQMYRDRLILTLIEENIQLRKKLLKVEGKIKTLMRKRAHKKLASLIFAM